MNNLNMAKGYLEEARIRLETAERALKEKYYAYSIRQSQECVELSLKSALRYVGIEPPKWHDVGIVIKENIDRFPEWFHSNVNRIMHISRELRREREPSMYGDESLGIPARMLYTEYDSSKAVDDAKYVFKICERLLK
jgi:HEPN domain-containing protein